MPARLLLLALCAALLLLLVPAAPPAAADDASVKRAWDSEDAAFTELGRSVRREQRRWQARGFTGDAKLLRLLRRGERLCGVVVGRLQAEQPSSEAGGQARDAAIASTTTFAQFFVAERSFVRAAGRPMSARARRLERRVIALDRRSRELADRALALFRSVGIT